jgi:PAS domain S-box-containing protein
VYTILNIGIGLIVFYKSHKSFLSTFYLICVLFLALYGAAIFVAESRYYQIFKIAIEPTIVFFFALIPFFFLHFIIIFTGNSKILQKKRLTFFIYLIGLLCYTLILLNLIPNPITTKGFIFQSGYVFYLTWMSIYFALGISQLYHLIGGFSDKGHKSNFLFTSFVFLLLLLPGPFADSILTAFFGKNIIWYFSTSILGLMAAVYFIFRHKSVITSYDALKATLAVMHDIIIKTDENFIIEMIRGAIFQHLGYEENELLGKPLSVIINQKDYVEYYQKFVVHGKMQEGFFDTEAIDKNGNLVSMNFSFAPVKSNDTITGFVGVGRNISERKRYEKELQSTRNNLEILVKERTTELSKVNDELQKDIASRKETEEKLLELNKQLHDLNAGKDKFFSIVAHDLKAPFQGLLGYSNILLEDFDNLSREELKEFIRNINDISKNVFGLVENLLSWARVQLGKIDFQPITLNLKEIVTNIVNILNHNAMRKGIKIKTLIDRDIEIKADEKMLNSILSNLIANAIKFTHKNGEVTVSAINNTNHVEISIKDNGIGINKENQKMLFRIDSSFKREGTAKEESTGLGLILCKELVEKHGGKIWINSEFEKGSTFSFTIPKA